MDLEFNFEKRHRLVREIIETIVLTLLMFLVIRLAVQNFNVDGHSMEPNLHNGELILVDKWSYKFHPPARGDVVVFVAPPQPTQDYIKRVVGLPGDVISIQDTTVTVNGKALDEKYIDPQLQGNPFSPIANRVIPPNTYFVLGDNRNGSSDSRDWGCVPAQNVIGRAALVYWPLGQDNNGLLPNVGATFNNIPQPQASGPTNKCPIANPNQAAATGQSAPVSGDMLNVDTALMLVMPGICVACGRGGRRRKQSA